MRLLFASGWRPGRYWACCQLQFYQRSLASVYKYEAWVESFCPVPVLCCCGNILGRRVSPCSSGRFRILLSLAVDLPFRHLHNSSSLLFWEKSSGFYFSFVPLLMSPFSPPPSFILPFFSLLLFFSSPTLFPAPCLTVFLFFAYAC